MTSPKPHSTSWRHSEAKKSGALTPPHPQLCHQPPPPSRLQLHVFTILPIPTRWSPTACCHALITNEGCPFTALFARACEIFPDLFARFGQRREGTTQRVTDSCCTDNQSGGPPSGILCLQKQKCDKATERRGQTGAIGGADVLWK